MSVNYPPRIWTHVQRTRQLYKEASRLVESYYHAKALIRYQRVLLRARFDENKCVSDKMDQRRLLYLGFDEVFKKKHPVPIAKFPRSLGLAGGVAFARVVEPPDWVMDYWHPYEKQRYPCYFQTRERRKCEYIELWRSDTMY